MNKPLSIVFFSSSDFVLPILEDIMAQQGKLLVNVARDQLNKSSFPVNQKFLDIFEKNQKELEGFQIVRPSVITQPDRELRGKTIRNPVSEYALMHEISRFQPERIRKSLSEFDDFITQREANIGIVASFGQILPAYVLDAFTHGMINWHPSLLPLYRGPTPMQSVLFNNENETGLTWMTMDEGMDSGNILLQINIPISPSDTTSVMSKNFGKLGADTWAIAVCIQLLTNGFNALDPIIQNHEEATFTKMIEKDDRNILPAFRSAKQIINHFRAYDLFPGTVVTSEHFHSDIRLDMIEFEPIKAIEDEIVFEDSGLIQTKSRKTYLKTLDGFVELVSITIMDSGKRVNLKGFEFK